MTALLIDSPRLRRVADAQDDGHRLIRRRGVRGESAATGFGARRLALMSVNL
jgi:hypothetical protein